MVNFKPLTSINISGSETPVAELADSIVTGRIAGDYPGNVKVLTLELFLVTVFVLNLISVLSLWFLSILALNTC